MKNLKYVIKDSEGFDSYIIIKPNFDSIDSFKKCKDYIYVEINDEKISSTISLDTQKAKEVINALQSIIDYREKISKKKEIKLDLDEEDISTLLKEIDTIINLFDDKNCIKLRKIKEMIKC
jgi:Asp-tRNA(Asn)/Glu-tRNA(Gln) amidotransferase C subunit